MMRDEGSRFERSDIFFAEDAGGRRALAIGGRWAVGAFMLGLLIGFLGTRGLF
ncbi:MAG: hypothetical protein ISP90_00010 [Nevskia sp.]|nr:hypothetical protein [Nevskia sp.]